MARIRICVFSLTVAALVAPVAVPAQDIGPALDPGVMVGWAGGEAVRYDNQRRSGGRTSMGSSARALNVRSFAPSLRSAPSGAVRVNPAALTYRPSAEVRKANFARFVEKSRAQDPEGAAKLERFFRSTDVMGLANQWMKPYGMVSSNVADATAVYLTTAWLATKGSSEDPDPATMRAVRSQVASAISSTSEFANATDAQKQELAEAMIVQAILVSQYAEAAKGNPELMRTVQDAVATGARTSFGFDLRSLNLSAKGLR